MVALKTTNGVKEVLAVGEGKVLESGEIRALAVKVGDQVVFGPYAGNNTITIDGEELILMIVLFILTIIEFKTAKIYNYEELAAEDAYAIPDKNNIKSEALRMIFSGTGNEGDKLETSSLPGRLNLKGEPSNYDSDSDPEDRHRRRSFPCSPKAEKWINNPKYQMGPGDVLE